jgi:small-conductance mechanosensitive channel
MNGAEEVTGVLRDITPMVLLQLALILLAAWVLIYLVQRILPWLAERVPGRYRVYLLATVPVLRLSIIVGTVALLVPRIIQPTFENLVTLLGALGIAIGFAFKDYVSSLIAGIVTLYEMPYRPGDWIEIEGEYGEVRTIGMRAVEICTPDDAIVVIPHLKLWDNLIKNANDGTRDLMCIASFYLQPRHEPVQVRRTLHEVALTSPYVQLRRPIQVLAEEQPWATRYWIKAYPVDLRHQFQFTTDLTLRGKAALSEIGAAFAAVAVADRTDAR